jgi:hypothetical protein
MLRLHTLVSFVWIVAALSLPAAAQALSGTATGNQELTRDQAELRDGRMAPPKLRRQAKSRHSALSTTVVR